MSNFTQFRDKLVDSVGLGGGAGSVAGKAGDSLGNGIKKLSDILFTQQARGDAAEQAASVPTMQRVTVMGIPLILLLVVGGAYMLLRKKR